MDFEKVLNVVVPVKLVFVTQEIYIIFLEHKYYKHENTHPHTHI